MPYEEIILKITVGSAGTDSRLRFPGRSSSMQNQAPGYFNFKILRGLFGKSHHFSIAEFNL